MGERRPAALPKSAHPAAKKALAEIHNAEDKVNALAAAKTFAAEFGVKWPKAVAEITNDLDVLIAFYDYRTQSSRPSHGTAQNPGHRRPWLASRQRRHGLQVDQVSPTALASLDAPHLVALVRAGATLINGKRVERPDDQDQRGHQQAA